MVNYTLEGFTKVAYANNSLSSAEASYGRALTARLGKKARRTQGGKREN